MTRKYDLIVIGGGTGLDVANAAAREGYRVALVEKDMLGGTCLNRGCIPSKLLIHSANVIQTIKNSEKFGITVRNLSTAFEKIVKRVNGITDEESSKIRKGLLESKNPFLYTRECYFVGKKKLAFKNTSYKQENSDNRSNTSKSHTITADKILIATGTVPIIPNIKGLKGSGYKTSNEALRLRKRPKTVTFIGGGYIACELAHFFGSLGTKINIIQRNSLLIPNEDIDVSEKFTKIFSDKYNVFLGYEAESVSVSKVKDFGDYRIHNADSDKQNKKHNVFHVTATHKDTQSKIEVESDELIICVGRRPDLSSLSLDKTGVSINKNNGFILVDKYLQTSMPGIFALGDVVGRYQFKHSANLEAKYAYHNLLLGIHENDKKMIKVDYTAMPHAIFSSPQVAGVGDTEQQLKKQNKIKYLKSVYPYIQTGMGLAIEDRQGFVKFLVNKENRKILGCHILGTDASTLIHEVLVAMRTGDATIDSISNTIHIHPALSEVVERAASSIKE